MNLLSLLGLFKQRTLLWSLQQFISKGVDIKGYLRKVMLGVMAAAAGGVLLALAIGAGLSALYFYLTTQQNYDVATALTVVGLTALLPAGALFWLAQSSLHSVRGFRAPETPEAPAVGIDHLTKATGDVVNAFIEGLLTKKPRARIVRAGKTMDAQRADDSRRKNFKVVG